MLAGLAPGREDRLDHERGVPELRRVVSLHLDAVLRAPEIVGKSRGVTGELRTLRALEVPDQRVEQLIHRAEADVIGRRIFRADDRKHARDRPPAPLR